MSAAGGTSHRNPVVAAREALGSASDAVRDWWAGAPKWARYLTYLVLIVLLVLAPSDAVGRIMTPDSYWPGVLFFPIGVYILLAIGLNVVVGQAGLLDLGYVAFWAIGGYTLAVLATRYGMNFWEVVVIAVVISAISGLILGAPTLRLRGDYLAIVTLGFGEIVRITAQNSEFLGGVAGIKNIPHPPSIEGVSIFGVDIFRYGIVDLRPYYYLLLALGVLVVVFVRRLEKSRVGRAWAAIREDEDAAEIMGVPTFRFKLLAFVVGASIGGLTGVVYAAEAISVLPNAFQFIVSATVLICVVLGGSGNLPGVVIGAFLIAWLPERFRGFQEWRFLVFGALLVILMAWRPEGLLPSRQRRAELKEGQGGMGSMGAEVGGPKTSAAAEVAE
jgi:branched-chain amino acid transport system permease protein